MSLISSVVQKCKITTCKYKLIVQVLAVPLLAADLHSMLTVQDLIVKHNKLIM